MYEYIKYFDYLGRWTSPFNAFFFPVDYSPKQTDFPKTLEDGHFCHEEVFDSTLIFRYKSGLSWSNKDLDLFENLSSISVLPLERHIVFRLEKINLHNQI